MRAPAFWQEQGLAALALAPLGRLYGAATLARMRRPGIALPCPVLCFGNPTLGGSGKTPLVRLATALLREAGHRPAVLLRGYGGRLEGPLIVAGHSAAEVGDEALLHASSGVLTVIARDRAAGGRLAVNAGATHILMDDGFQNPSLVKTASLLVVDGATGLGNGLVFPAGPLRAPFAAQMAQAQALVVMGGGAAGDALAQEAQGKPVIRARLVPEQGAIAALKGQSLIAFCGIGRPDKLRDTLEAHRLGPVVLKAFPDHHAYTDSEAESLLRLARDTGARLVTTEKDAVKLTGSPRLAALREAASVLPVRAEITEGETAFRAVLGI